MGSDDLFKKQQRGKKVTDFKRNVASRGKTRDLILIVCEGTKTEPNYFNGFRLPNVDTIGIGGDPVTVVQRAIQISKDARKKENKIYDQVWCVFDRDSFPIQRFKEAFLHADHNNIHVAYSNEAFELWYILHFEYLNTGITRQTYISKLTTHLGRKYNKNDPKIYEDLLLLGNQSLASRYAQKLLDAYPGEHPEAIKPSTTVHNLVKVLNQWKKPH